MSWETQRGITQLITGLCALCLAAGLLVQSWRLDGRRWPLQWRTLVGMWLAGIGLSEIAHAFIWFRHEQDALRNPLIMWWMWLVAILGIVTFIHWLRHKDDDPHV